MTTYRKQALFFDAIEFSFRMVQVVYQRLLQTCMKFSEEEIQNNSIDRPIEILMLDAWSIIDITNRLRTMLEKMPGLKHSTNYTLFMKKTKEIPDLRNYIQHLAEKTFKVINSK